MKETQLTGALISYLEVSLERCRIPRSLNAFSIGVSINIFFTLQTAKMSYRIVVEKHLNLLIGEKMNKTQKGHYLFMLTMIKHL